MLRKGAIFWKSRILKFLPLVLLKFELNTISELYGHFFTEFRTLLNLLSARIFTIFGQSLLEDRVLQYPGP